MTYGISGGPIGKFREGWAIIPFIEKPHYWKRRELGRTYNSKCGLTVGPTLAGVEPLTDGVFAADRCKRCASKMHRRAVTVSVTHEPTVS